MNELENIARELLEKGEAATVIGWGEAGANRTRPVFITKAGDAGRLIFNHHCLGNLAVYLTRRELRARGRVAVTVKGCDARAVAALVQENRVPRDGVCVIGMRCNGVVSDFGLPWEARHLAAKCTACAVRTPPFHDLLAGTAGDLPATEDRFAPLVARLEAMSSDERFAYWEDEFARCIKCYACRQVCPLCYCERCVADKCTPRWVESSATRRGNLAWQLVRAFHQSGRCVGCGECERACPRGIPLSLLNRKMAAVARERFGYVAGMDPAAATCVGTYAVDDREEFIK